ncbi:hypothetical protein [Streptomyces chilikensis]|uniref:Uncharacterized protein n=1 Tax=Streptomyces chilikensis TaxID=1194079 RepID=A0ABV3EJE1_9ACTN
MARTGCGGSSCQCVIIPGPGMVVEGTGSLSNPYVLSVADQVDPPENPLSVAVVSLLVDTPQTIPADGAWHIVRFPYIGESSDVHGMHEPMQPDGYQVVDWATNDRSGLVWPSVAGWGILTANLHWEEASGSGGGYTELRDQFIRTPFTAPDTTATDHRAPTPGGNFFTKQHSIFVNPSTPLALRVAHNDSVARQLTLAEFKLAIFQ